MWRKKGRFRKHIQKKDNNDNKEDKGKDQVTCYECNKPGHYRSECPNLKKKFKRDHKEKKKSLMATWDDSDTSSDEDEECANMALMARTDSDSDDKVIFELNPHIILQHEFDELLCEPTKLAIEYKALKRNTRV